MKELGELLCACLLPSIHLGLAVVPKASGVGSNLSGPSVRTTGAFVGLCIGRELGLGPPQAAGWDRGFYPEAAG